MFTTISFEITEIGWLKPDPRNSRTHSKKQINLIAGSMGQSGFVNPILANPVGVIIAGHGRLLAAKQLGLKEVPVITITGLSEAQERRLRIADNKIALHAGWDLDLLRPELNFIEGSGLDLTLTGFSVGEIDVLRMPKLELVEPFDPVPVEAVTQRSDIWMCNGHRVGCGDLLDGASLKALMSGAEAHAIIADSPYNTSNATHNGGSGRFKHREFAYAHGEMGKDEFIRFLTDTQTLMAGCCAEGAVAFMFMDHHHAGEQIAAGEAAFDRRLNIAIWVKSNAGMGSLYRSGHEMIFVYAVHKGPYRNNVELGKHGRNRTNVFHAPSVNAFGSRQDDLSLHATVKPIQLFADMIMDVTRQGDIVLDGFLGSGTTLLAAERTGRRAYSLEIDAAYVDVAITRWMDLTGHQAVLESTGETFVKVRRRREVESGSSTVHQQGETNNADSVDNGDTSKPAAKAASRYANAPYAVGKGKTPMHSQFKPGCKPGPGRPKGKRNRSSLDKLLDQRVTVGEDRLGRPIRKTWREVTDYQLMKLVQEKDFRAIRLVKEYEYRLAELERRYGPKPLSREELLKEAAEQAEREKYAAKLTKFNVGLMEVVAQLKRYGLVEFRVLLREEPLRLQSDTGFSHRLAR